MCKSVVTPQCNFVSHLILQSTGGSTGEDEEDLSGTCLETKHNTHHNEFLDHELIEVSACDFHLLKRKYCHLYIYCERGQKLILCVTKGTVYVRQTTHVSGTDSKNVYTKAKQKV